MADIQTLPDVVIQGEGRWFKFTYLDTNSQPIVMPASGYIFILKQSVGAATTLFTANSFDVSSRATGIIRVNVPASVSIVLPPGSIFGQMTAVITAGTDVDIQKFKFKVEADI